MHARGPEQGIEDIALCGLVEAGVGTLQHLHRVRLRTPERIDDRLDQHAALNLRLS